MKKILVIGVIILCVGLLSGCTQKNDLIINENNRGFVPSLELDTIHLFGDVVRYKMFNLSYDGFKDAIEASRANNHTTFYFPNGTMDIYGTFNDSIFTIDNDNVTIIGQGENIDSYNKYGELVFTRSEKDTIFRIFNNSGRNCSVLKINGNNCVVHGIQFHFMFSNEYFNDRDMNALSMFGTMGIISENYIRFGKNPMVIV